MTSLTLSGTVSHLGDKANHKIDEIHTRLALRDNIEIITVSETWLDHSIADESINIPGDALLRKDGEVVGFVHTQKKTYHTKGV
jgi:hypothetical protein